MNNLKWSVRVIDLKAKKEGKGFLEVANNFFIVAESKQKARKDIQQQFQEKDMVYGRDYVLGIVTPYTGKGISVGFVGDTFKCCVPCHKFIAYKTFQEKLDSGRNSEVKNETYTKDVVLKNVPEDLSCPTYICSKGEFVEN